jgi:hypothetical protein
VGTLLLGSKEVTATVLDPTTRLEPSVWREKIVPEIVAEALPAVTV